jgi:hypothetical protein
MEDSYSLIVSSPTQVMRLMMLVLRITFTPIMMKEIEVPRIIDINLSSKYILQTVTSSGLV